VLSGLLHVVLSVSACVAKVARVLAKSSPVSFNAAPIVAT
jgi:hypothetical protein